ncbi:MarR family winged helix-turn-helix transcriptional regulator [Microbacterium invictum]|uniref:MarR family winged helix-turn-helix transcriptional regulator n=1 Tax=Microbacterium invictum TaxID=515415 RepID=A0ABZ0VBK0_9MICO|nr:MarR family winged helix-turn-helix transcriptional regulator [Microbacterium invictum]WQB69935.1 MarR family winged helix-turn-helix transcriptional regulator [Microbacterium invictum]
MTSAPITAADAAVTSDTITMPLEDVIDPDEFTPRLLALLSNALVYRESHELRRQFKLGTNEWRVISALSMRPGMSATEVCEFLGMNKAVVSRSVTRLQLRALIVLSDGPRGSRPLYLTRAGAEMHDRMLPVSLRGQEIITEGLGATEVAALNEVLRGMLARIRSDAALQGAPGSPSQYPID